MRQHDVLLQGDQILGGDADAGELPETGIDAIDRLAPRHDPRDRIGAGLNARMMPRIELRRSAAIDRAPVGQRHRTGFERRGHGRLLICLGILPGTQAAVTQHNACRHPAVPAISRQERVTQ